MEHTQSGDAVTASILHFPRRRGRPRNALKASKDSGTPELVMKRLLHQTAEAIDLCLERNIITPEQHWCGIHLRWLYTLRYGVPGIRAIDPSHFGGIEIKNDDPDWRAAREKEFAEAVLVLKHKHASELVINICIFNERPDFLHITTNFYSERTRKNERQLLILNEGLNALVDLWQQ